MASTTRYSHIITLKEDNFSDWLIDVRAHLRKDKLWKYTQEVPDAEKKSSEWEEKAQEAADFMTPTISPAVKRKLTEAEFNNGYQMITRLTALLAPKGEAQFMRLSREYYTLQLSHFKDIPELLTRIKELEEQIDATKVEMTGDKRTILCLSMALSEHYRPLVQLWSMNPEITTEKAKEMLLEEHRRYAHTQEEEERAHAYVGRFGKQEKSNRKWNGNGNGNGNGHGTSKECSKCEKTGHTIDECWEEHPEMAPEWLQEKKKRRQNDGNNRNDNRARRARFPMDQYAQDICPAY